MPYSIVKVLTIRYLTTSLVSNIWAQSFRYASDRFGVLSQKLWMKTTLNEADEVRLGVLGNRGTRPSISGKQGNKNV